MDKISAQGCGVFLGILAAGMALGVFSVPALALVAALLAALALLVSFWGIWESRRTRKGVVFAAAGVILSLASLGAIGAALLSNAAGVKTPQDSAQLNAPQTRRQSPPATHAIAPPPLPKEPGEPAKPSSTNKPVEPDARVTPPENGTATPTPSTAPEETTSADGMLRSVDMGQPQEQPPSQAERLSERISALSAESASLPEAELWTKASALRADIRALGNDVNTTAPLDTQLDKVIADKLERKAEEPLAQAQQTYNGGELEKAIAAARQVYAVFQAPDAPLLANPQSLQSKAWSQAQMIEKTAQARMEMADNPAVRFRLRGIMGGAEHTYALLDDLLLGKQASVRVGDRLDTFRVDSIDAKQGTVILSRGSKTATIFR